MLDIAVLAYVPDPFGVQTSLYMVSECEGGISFLSAQELSSYEPRLLTYDVPALVDDLRRLGHPPPNNILDIGDALRLKVGRSKDDGGEKKWAIWPSLKRRFARHSDAETFELITVARAIRPEADELTRLLVEAVKALQKLWADLVIDLRSVGELDRLTKIEWPLQSNFAYRQFRGIRINNESATALLAKISAEKYAAYREVAKILDKSLTGLTFWNINRYLDRTDLALLADIEPGGRLQDAFELTAPTSTFAKAFLSLIKSGRDAIVIRRSTGVAERLFPIFQVLGTITGRILVADPFLQQLRRAYRSLIIADVGAKLIYLDYAQFEPGVLAGLSEDYNFISAYNAGDIYTALAELLFGDASSRPIAKRVFLAFSYGMSPERIAALLMGGQRSEERLRDYVSKIEEFFKAFPGLAAYRLQQQQKLQEDGFVSSLFGNRRARMNKGGELSSKEKRWALNHPVQSTASLIFKEALLEIIREFGADKVILPVHDAVLIQLDDDEMFGANVDRIRTIMIDAFKNRLPQIKARVTVGHFAD